MIFQTSATNFFHCFSVLFFICFVHGRELSKYLVHKIIFSSKCSSKCTKYRADKYDIFENERFISKHSFVNILRDITCVSSHLYFFMKTAFGSSVVEPTHATN